MAKSSAQLARHAHSLLAALIDIENTPATMVNDSESLRHTIRTMQQIARAAMAKIETIS